VEVVAQAAQAQATEIVTDIGQVLERGESRTPSMKMKQA
jgi:hypothetical protein